MSTCKGKSNHDSSKWRGQMRPEKLGISAAEYFNAERSKAYIESSAVASIQKQLTDYAVLLLDMPREKASQQKKMVLDIGCGNYLSSEVFLKEYNSFVLGFDISLDMLTLDKEKRPISDCFVCDMSTMCFRQNLNIFDVAVSISAVQWILDDTSKLTNFFQLLYSSLKNDGKMVFQFYISDNEQAVNVVNTAREGGFYACFVGCYPHATKSKTKDQVKLYLCLSKQTDLQEINPSCKYISTFNKTQVDVKVTCRLCFKWSNKKVRTGDQGSWYSKDDSTRLLLEKHVKYVNRLLRILRRQQSNEFVKDPLTASEQALAELVVHKLSPLLGKNLLQELQLDTLYNHSDAVLEALHD